jgi:hypothetical protein
MKVIAVFFYLSVMGAITNQCFAQDIEPPRLAVKWSFPHLLYFYPSIQIGLEHKLFDRVNLQYDLGLVFHPPLSSNKSYENRRGFRGIGELRYYVPSPPKIPFYLAGEFYYSKIQFDRSNVIGYDCSGDCLYYEYITYRMDHRQQGVGLKYGLLLFPGWNRNRSFFFDINAGVSYRSVRYSEPGKPTAPNITFFENDEDDDNLFSPDEHDRTEFRPMIGIRIGYSFIK